MSLDTALSKTKMFSNIDILVDQLVEGTITGMHKSPFHGFSSEFAEHKPYYPGDSTRYIDWKLFAKTDTWYTKCFDAETNMRCHFIIDNSSSMHYPPLKKQSLSSYNKIGFSVLCALVLQRILKKQRDAVGLSIYDTQYRYYAPEKTNQAHHYVLQQQLNTLVKPLQSAKATQSATCLHQIASKLKRRSMVILFTDFFTSDTNITPLLEALQHLRHNKHKVVLFHVVDKKTELAFDFDTQPRTFIDVETNKQIKVHPEHIKKAYQEQAFAYQKQLQEVCLDYKIRYVEADIGLSVEKNISRYFFDI